MTAADDRAMRALRSAIDVWDTAHAEPRCGDMWPAGHDEHVADAVMRRYGKPGSDQVRKSAGYPPAST